METLVIVCCVFFGVVIGAAFGFILGLDWACLRDIDEPDKKYKPLG